MHPRMHFRVIVHCITIDRQSHLFRRDSHSFMSHEYLPKARPGIVRRKQLLVCQISMSQKLPIILRGIAFIKPDGGCNLSGHPRVSAKSEPERETNCRFSIRNYQTITVNSGYKRRLFHFSGPKGRRFKSCHLDQRQAFIGWFFCAFCTKTVDFSGLR